MKFEKLIEHYERAIGFESTVKGVPVKRNWGEEVKLYERNMFGDSE